MPWKKDHKEETRARILDAASAAIREKGVAGVGVADMMEAAGLTHGGFYAHFKSKDALVAEAFDFACEQSGRKLEAAAARAPAGEQLLAVAEAYLTAAHARHPEKGCPVSTVGPDLVRSGGDAREAVAQAIRERLDWLESIAPGESAEAKQRNAAETYAAMLGAIFVARALGGVEGERYLERVRASLRQRQSGSH
jgi:TetR/AcrR family transcriptional regulator, transcriptional repressor for nem operon